MCFLNEPTFNIEFAGTGIGNLISTNLVENFLQDKMRREITKMCVRAAAAPRACALAGGLSNLPCRPMLQNLFEELANHEVARTS